MINFHHIFDYRLQNILVNRKIVKAKLVNEKDSWQVFMRLVKSEGLGEEIA